MRRGKARLICVIVGIVEIVEIVEGRFVESGIAIQFLGRFDGRNLGLDGKGANMAFLIPRFEKSSRERCKNRCLPSNHSKIA